MGKTYQITKKVCQKQIDERGNVCDYCGRDIVPIETVDNSDNPTYWAGCMHGTDWGCYTIGVKKEIFELAEKLVCDGERSTSYYNKFEYKDDPDKRLYWFQQQVSGFCSQLRHAEYLKNNPARKTKDEFLTDPNW